MELSPPPPTPRLHLCKLLSPAPSTSIRCRAISYKSVCRMATRETAPLPSIAPFIKPSLWYLRNGRGQGKIAWGPPLAKILQIYQVRDRKHRNCRHTPGFKAPSTAVISSKHLHRFSTCSMRVPRRASRRSYRIKRLPLRAELNECQRHHHHRFRLQSKHLLLKHLPPTLSMVAESPLLRMEANHTRRTCHILAVRINPSPPLLDLIAPVQLLYNIITTPRLSRGKGCMRCV